MTYVDGFVIVIPEKNLEAYRKMAEQASKIWKEYGALDYKECVGDDVDIENHGSLPFTKLAGVKNGERIIFSYIVYKSRAHRDEVNAKVMADPRLMEGCDPNNMPFEMNRMSYGGFSTIVEY